VTICPLGTFIYVSINFDTALSYEKVNMCILRNAYEIYKIVKTRKSKTIANERIKSCPVFVCCITLNEYQNNSWLKLQTSNYIYNASVLKYCFLVFNVMFKTQ